MRTRLLLALVLSLSTLCIVSQELYIKTFGNSKDTPILFLHGGPGYNSSNFEGTTAKKLSEKGFFVIVYDRRGEGRSKDSLALFNFDQTIKDINLILDSYQIKNTTLIGHSFGGVVGTKYLEAYPEKVNSLILVGAPVSFQETFQTIIKASEKIFKEKKDKASLSYLDALQKMDNSSIQYSGFCFMYAMRNGFYSPAKPSNNSITILSQFKKDSTLYPYSRKMSNDPVKGFWKNESYTTIDLSANLSQLVSEGNKIKGLYGDEDGLFSKKQLKKHSKILGESNLKTLTNCSHNVFIDQQEQFIELIVEWSK